MRTPAPAPVNNPSTTIVVIVQDDNRSRTAPTAPKPPTRPTSQLTTQAPSEMPIWSTEQAAGGHTASASTVEYDQFMLTATAASLGEFG
jgi:hypothetical protein